MLHFMRCMAVVASVAILALSQASPATAGIKRWGPEYFPNDVVYDQNGKALHFYDDVIKDKIVIVSFIFAKCKDLCPLTTARLAEVRHRLGDAVGKDIFMVSISIDPEHDTPDVLKAYAEPFEIGPGWQFITGSREVIDKIRSKLGEMSRKMSEHTAEVLLGNDRTGEWGHDSAMSDASLLEMNIREMDPVWRNTPHQLAPVAASTSQTPLPALPGVAMFRKLCMSCHTVGTGDRVGPDLLGVGARRDPNWLVTVISDPDKLRRAKDPVLTALTEKFKGANMPSLGLSPSEATDLIDYLNAETQAQAAKPTTTGDTGSAKTVAVK